MKNVALWITVLALGVMACKRTHRVSADQAKAPASVQSQASMHDTLFTYAKTPCFGGCQVFSLVVFNDYTFLYDGKKNVAHEGRYMGKFTAAQVQGLQQWVKAHPLNQYSPVYDNPQVTDLPSTLFGYALDPAHLLKIKCRYQYPEEFRELFTLLNEMIESASFEPLNNTDIK